MSKTTIMSFGFKYGLPNANYYFDVAFIKNPAREQKWGFFAPADKEMEQYVLSQKTAKNFLDRLFPLLETLLDIDQHQVFAFGCNSGRHRSFIVAEYIYSQLKDREYDVRIKHRDID